MRPASSAVPRSRTRGWRTSTGPMPVITSRSGKCPCRTTRRKLVAVFRSACLARNSATSASIACASRARAPLRSTSVSGSANDAAPGVDGVTWETYEQDLDRRIEDLYARVKSGAYRARPSRRSYIPKEDGSKRPLAVAAREDMIVQRATAPVLSAIYEEDFLGFSYGFRPGRSQHDALDAPIVG